MDDAHPLAKKAPPKRNISPIASLTRLPPTYEPPYQPTYPPSFLSRLIYPSPLSVFSLSLLSSLYCSSFHVSSLPSVFYHCTFSSSSASSQEHLPFKKRTKKKNQQQEPYNCFPATPLPFNSSLSYLFVDIPTDNTR